VLLQTGNDERRVICVLDNIILWQIRQSVRRRWEIAVVGLIVRGKSVLDNVILQQIRQKVRRRWEIAVVGLIVRGKSMLDNVILQQIWQKARRRWEIAVVGLIVRGKGVVDNVIPVQDVVVLTWTGVWRLSLSNRKSCASFVTSFSCTIMNQPDSVAVAANLLLWTVNASRSRTNSFRCTRTNTSEHGPVWLTMPCVFHHLELMFLVECFFRDIQVSFVVVDNHTRGS
jgi:hypothetical protein